MELYEEIKKDREAGARRLVNEYRSRLMGMAMGLTKSPHEAEDLVFRTFERVILKIDDYKPTGSFYYWVCTILVNFHRMDIRKASVRPKFIGDGTIPEVAVPESHDISDQMDFEMTAEAVRAAVRELPDNFREVVVLKYFDDMSLEDIAMVTGLNVGTVKSRLHYAKEALYAKLHDTELSAKFTDRLILATRRRSFMKWTVGAVAMLFLCTVIAGVAISFSSGSSGFGGGRFRGYGGGGHVRRATDVGGATVTADAVERAIGNGLEYLARQQRENGSYPAAYGESAAVPALAGMAFLAKGHLPGSEPYGDMINRAIDFVISCADMRDNAPFKGYMGNAGNGRMYAHSIATLFLAEASGMVDDRRQEKIDKLLPLATKVILDAQGQKKGNPQHLGGWRYQPNSSDSDLSCSGWALMALRSARLNGAQVPPEAIEKAVLYIKRSQNEGSGAFSYQGNGGGSGDTLTGAAILCLELCGKHLDPASMKGAKYLEKRFRQALSGGGERFYGLYYTAQGLFQIGGPVWRDFSTWMYDKFVPEQRADGAWTGAGNNGSDIFSTAMTILSLTVPYRMLPIYQRDETVDPDSEKETK